MLRLMPHTSHLPVQGIAIVAVRLTLDTSPEACISDVVDLLHCSPVACISDVVDLLYCYLWRKGWWGAAADITRPACLGTYCTTVRLL